MKENKGITLIALVITIIIMLILVGATITILTQGDLINKAKNAVIGTDAAQQNETNKSQSLGWEILEATVDPETFTLGQPYPELYMKKEPISLAQLNPEVLNLLDEEDNFVISTDKLAMWISPMTIGGGWGASNKTFVAQETEPTNPNQDDYWINTSLTKTYRYDNNAWVEEDIPIYLSDEEFPLTANVGELAIYNIGGNPILIEWSEEDRSLLILIVNGESYMYLWTDAGAANLNQMVEGLTAAKGWNSIVFENDGLSSAVPTTYSEVANSLSSVTDITLTDSPENEAKISYLGYFFRSTPWLGQ